MSSLEEFHCTIIHGLHIVPYGNISTIYSPSTGEMGERVRVAGERLRKVEGELEEGQEERSKKYNELCSKEKMISGMTCYVHVYIADLILGVSCD